MQPCRCDAHELADLDIGIAKQTKARQITAKQSKSTQSKAKESKKENKAKQTLMNTESEAGESAGELQIEDMQV